MGRSNEDVIEVHCDEAKLSENCVHMTLKCLCSVAKTKWHCQILIQTKRCDESCFWDIIWMDGHLVVGAFEVEFTKDFGVGKTVC